MMRPTTMMTLPEDSQERKEIPLYRGLLRYFPAALAAAARVSKVGNDKHNPGEEMHHARGKSGDHADCILRHLTDLEENHGRDEIGLPQVGYIVWRALALAQEWLEKHEGAPLAPGAKLPIPPAGDGRRVSATEMRATEDGRGFYLAGGPDGGPVSYMGDVDDAE